MSTKKSSRTKAAAKAAVPVKSAAKTAAQPEGRKLSLLSAAAAVLAECEEPLNCRRMIELAKEKGLWTPGAGKTPEQTLYSAIVREIKEKGDASRFRKSPLRGHYSANAAE